MYTWEGNPNRTKQYFKDTTEEESAVGKPGSTEREAVVDVMFREFAEHIERVKAVTLLRKSQAKSTPTKKRKVLQVIDLDQKELVKRNKKEWDFTQVHKDAGLLLLS